MLDIVFIMLIFFIVTTTFSNELGLASERPPESKTKATSESLSIQIDELGQIRMLGRIVDIRRVVNSALWAFNTNAKARFSKNQHLIDWSLGGL